MTANEDVAQFAPVDLDAALAHLDEWGAIPDDWTCSLIAEVRELRSRACIGPDSERIRELEAEVERLWQRLKANAVTIGRYRLKEMIDSGVMESQPHPKPEAEDSDPADYGYYDPRNPSNADPTTTICRNCKRPAIEHTSGRYSIHGVCPPHPAQEQQT